MSGRFFIPSPNCGHGGKTFAWYALGQIWLCSACDRSIGRLDDRCNRCNRPSSPNTQLIDVFRAGRLCFSCRRDFRDAARPS